MYINKQTTAKAGFNPNSINAENEGKIFAICNIKY